jgi:hypothetical protein
MGAKANRTYVSLIPESTWGVLPGTPELQKVNFTGESLGFEIQTKTPDTIRDDRMVSDVIMTSAGNTGGYEFEFQALASGADDPILVSALFSDVAWAGVNGATNTMDIEGAAVTAAGVLDCTARTPKPTLVPGQYFMVSGSAQNDGVYQITAVTDETNGVYTVSPAPAADETFGAGVSISGEYIRNGITPRSFAIERGHADVDEFFLFLGMIVGELSLSIVSEEVVTGSVSFMGKDAEVYDAPQGNTYLDQPVTQFMSAAFNVGEVKLDGSSIASCLLQSLTININNNIRGRSAVGQFGYCEIADGEFSVSGDINLTFLDASNWTKYKTNVPFSISFILYDNAGNAYIVDMPRCKFSADAVNATGKGEDVLDAAQYYALVDDSGTYAIQITRLTGYSPA